MRYRNAIFTVSTEHLCPIYNVGEEFRVEDDILTVPEAKATCLILAGDIITITLQQKRTEKPVFERYTQRGVQKSRFTCGGCKGKIGFEYKREKEFTTPQMKMMAMAELRRKTKHLDKFAAVLRTVDIFSNMNENNLRDISALLNVQEFPRDTVILQKGEVGTDLYVILSGRVSVIDEDGEVLGVMEEGEIFGEMSLLSGSPVTKTVRTSDMSMIASLSNKDFRHILNKYRDLQTVFYKMLVDRAAKAKVKRAPIDIDKGLVGDLQEINAVELFQMINISQKNGRVDLMLDDDNDAVVFFVEGEVVKVTYGRKEDKDGLFALLGKNKGHFTFSTELPPGTMDLPAIGGFMGLLMEGMQRIDEG